MKRFRWLLPVLAAVLFLPSVAASQPAGKKTLLIGLIPEMNIFKQKKRFQLLGEYLSKKSGVEVRFTILSRYGNIIDRFTSEKMDGAFFGSFTGALAIRKLNVVPLARPVNLDRTSSYRGYLFVRKNSGIRTAADMKGKRMAFVEKATTAGYVFPLAFFREQGISDLTGFFSEVLFTGSHDTAIAAVLNGKADIGAAKHSIYDRVAKEDARVDRELVVIATSAWVPSNGLCVRRDIDPALRDRIREALLSLHTDPDGKRVLERFGAIKFTETSTRDYQPVFDLANRAGIDIGAYEYLNK